MSAVTLLPPVQNSNIPKLNTALKQKAESPGLQQIDKQLNAEGRTKIGEKALQESIKKLSEILNFNNFQVSTVFEAQQGIKKVMITDAISGKPVIEMPPEAATQIADRAKQQNIGWIIDLIA